MQVVVSRVRLKVQPAKLPALHPLVYHELEFTVYLYDRLVWAWAPRCLMDTLAEDVGC